MTGRLSLPVLMETLGQRGTSPTEVQPGNRKKGRNQKRETRKEKDYKKVRDCASQHEEV